MNKRIFLAADRIAFVIIPALLGMVYFNGNEHLYKERGSLSLNLLYVILFMKPIIVILGYPSLKKLLPYRRQLGMISFWLALFHTIGLIVVKNFWDISAYLSHPWSNYLLIGSLSMIGMLILALTSNFWSIKKLGANRKRVQRLAYPSLFLGKLHTDLSHGMSRGINPGSAPITTNTASTTISFTRYIPTLVLLILFIGLKYRQHKVESRQWRSVNQWLI